MTVGATTPLGSRRSVGWTELRVSPLALGTMKFGWSVSDVGAFDVLDCYREAGGNFIDTADMYGPDQRRRSFEDARPHVGVSEDIIGRWMAARLWKHNGGLPRLACEQPRASLVHWSEYEKQVRPVAIARDLGVICYSPLAAGFLSGRYRSIDDLDAATRGKYLAQYAMPHGWAVLAALDEVAGHHAVTQSAAALAWMLADEVVTAPIVDANSPEQLRSWAEAGSLRLSSEEAALLDSVCWSTSEIEFSSW